MSEYQYYEFQAIDRLLSPADRAALRALSTRAQITASSFTNDYQWGDFKGDPLKLMERCFDLHLYFANWGTRRLMIRLPARSVNRARLDAILAKLDCVTASAAGPHLILDIAPYDDDFDGDGLWEEDSEWLAALAPLREALIAGDLRPLYLLWLRQVEFKTVDAEAPEPLPGIGPITPALETFAEFFRVDPDLVAAAAERMAASLPRAISGEAARSIIAAMSEGEKTALLAGLFEGDASVAADLRVKVREAVPRAAEAPPGIARTAGELRARAAEIRLAGEQAEAAKLEAERQRQAKLAEAARNVRVRELARRGEAVWREVEAEIERRNASGYDKAAGLLLDLRALSQQRGEAPDFQERLLAIRERHAGKYRFLERLAKLGIGDISPSSA